MRHRVRELIGRARADLDLAARELEHGGKDDPMEQVLDEDPDLIEARARCDSLEARVSAIERQ